MVAYAAYFPNDGSLPCIPGRTASAFNLSRPAQRSLITACMLAESLNDPLHRRLRRSRYLLHRYDCYRLERPLPGRTNSTERPCLRTAHQTDVVFVLAIGSLVI